VEVDAPANGQLDEAASHNLGSGFGWAFVTTIVSRVATMAAGIAYAKLLAPAEIGSFALAFAFFSIVQSIADVGVFDVLLRYEGEPPEVANALSVAAGLFFFVVLQLAARSIATFGDNRQLELLVRVLSLAILIDCPFIAMRARLTQAFDQKSFLVAESVGLAFSITCALTIGSITHRAIGLAVGRVVGGLVVMAVLVKRSQFSFRMRWNGAAIKRILRLGTPIALSAGVALAVANIDFLLVGRLSGKTQLGIYAIAWNLSSWPVTLLGLASNRVSAAALRTVAHDETRQRKVLQAGLGILLFAALPMATGLAAFPRGLTTEIYGTAYKASGAVLELLAFVAIGRIVIQFLSDALISFADTRFLIKVQLGWLIFLEVALSILVPRYGIRGAAIAHLAVSVLWVLPVLVSRLSKSKSLGLPPKMLVLAVVAAAASVIPARALADRTPGNPLLGIAMGGLVILGFIVPFAFQPVRSSVRFLRTIK
jgi:O-antigen/teichoic acid export membrane protein